MFEHKTINELIHLASAGGGFTIKATYKEVNDLISLASAAQKGGARITLTGLKHREINELASIAKAGGGNITFAD